MHLMRRDGDREARYQYTNGAAKRLSCISAFQSSDVLLRWIFSYALLWLGGSFRTPEGLPFDVTPVYSVMARSAGNALSFGCSWIRDGVALAEDGVVVK